MAPLHAGWLSKKGNGNMGRWKEHWFVLIEGCLYYFLQPQDPSPRFVCLSIILSVCWLGVDA